MVKKLLTTPKKTVKKVASKKTKQVKKVVKKPITKKATQKITAEKKIATKSKLVIKKGNKEIKLGKVLHFFDKISVIAIKLKTDLAVGDTVRVKGGENTDFKQKISSMEIEGTKVKKAKKNQGIGFKSKHKARPGYWVYKL